MDVLKNTFLGQPTTPEQLKAMIDAAVLAEREEWRKNMSIELLPPDHEYPDACHVRSNWCRCHPETCGCNAWAVHAPGGEKHSTHFHEETANEVAEGLNDVAAMRLALDRIANMKNRDGVEIEMHREEMRAIARTALRSNV